MGLKKLGKRGIELSFGWMFALIAGAAILFLAVFFAWQLLKIGEQEVDAKTTEQLSILFDPMETGLASSRSFAPINLNRETRVYSECKETGEFGESILALSSKYFEKWSERGVSKKINNKYIFSEDRLEGKKLYFNSLPFEMPFKVSEIIMMYNKNYCFPEDSEISGSGIETDNCSSDSIKVCFESSCDISIYGLCSNYNCKSDYDYGYVIKNNSRMYFAGNLMYAAIFSSPENYECNVLRLMKRLSYLAILYQEEASFLEGRGISTGLESDMISLASLARSVKTSEDLLFMKEQVDIIESKNEALNAKLYEV